jgi:hypothetical protein
MVEVKYHGKSETQRLSDRLKPSNHMPSADTHVQQGHGPRRLHHTTHYGASNAQHSDAGSKTDLPVPQNIGAGAPNMGQKKGSNNV